MATCLLALSFPGSASACSCARGDARRALQRADAAFIGVLRAKQVEPGGQEAIYRFDVEDVVKGQLPATLDVRSAAHGAACGIETPIGGRTGLFLSRSGSVWRSSLCQQIRPDELRRAAAPLPQPNGRGPVGFLVAGAFGNARLLALDRSGRTLAYGFGGGTAFAVGICPGSRRVVEIVRDDDTLEWRLGIRDLRTMRVVSRVLLSRDRNESFRSVHCRDARARAVFAFAARYGKTLTSRVVRISRGTPTTIHRWSAEYATFRRGLAVLGGGSGIRSVELSTGRTRVVIKDEVVAPVGISPSGARLAVHLKAENRLATIDVSRRPARIAHGPRAPTNTFGALVWLTETRFGFFAGEGDSDRAMIYGRSFRRLGAFPWGAPMTIVHDGNAYGLSRGKLRTARLPAGPSRVLRTLVSADTYALASVPGNVRVALNPQTLACARG